MFSFNYLDTDTNVVHVRIGETQEAVCGHFILRGEPTQANITCIDCKTKVEASLKGLLDRMPKEYAVA